MLALFLLSTIAAVVPPNGAFTCRVIAVHDGDGPIRCANGIKVRVAGVQAPDYESAEPCRVRRAGYVCSDAQADRSRTIVTGMVLHQTLACVAVGKGYAGLSPGASSPMAGISPARSLQAALQRGGTHIGADIAWVPVLGGDPSVEAIEIDLFPISWELKDRVRRVRMPRHSYVRRRLSMGRMLGA